MGGMKNKILWFISYIITCLIFIYFFRKLIQSYGFSPAITSRLKHEYGENYIVFSALENKTIYYGVCKKNVKPTRQKECRVLRVGHAQEDECQITLSSESGGFIQTNQIKIEPLGKDRAILRWFESDGAEDDPYHLRFSIVDFSNCNIKTTKLSEDLNQLITNINDHSRVRILYSSRVWQRSCIENGDEKFNKLKYLKGEDDFEVVLEDWDKVYRSSIDSHGVASKVDTLLTYPEDALVEPLIVPLSKDEGYLFIETLRPFKPENPWIAVSLIQPNGQRTNLFNIDEDVSLSSVSLVNGLIGICVRQNNKAMKCVQFKLDDKRITLFSVKILEDYCEENRAIYNLPRGEGFLTYGVYDFGDQRITQDKYLVKVNRDEKDNRYLDPDTECEPEEASFNKIFEDDRGNYCVSTICMRRHEGYFSSYVKFHSKCYQPNVLMTPSSQSTIKMLLIPIGICLLFTLFKTYI